MSQIEMLLKEFEKEAVTTKKMLALIPEDQYDWKPHAKSGSLIWLSKHLAELPAWVKMALITNEHDFQKNPYTLPDIKNNGELLAFFDSNFEKSKQELLQANDDQLKDMWTLRSGEIIHNHSTKAEVIRMSYCQTVHHRAQLGVYLRLLDIPIPGSYGPSADEH
ncbi:DinB family protein [Chitinophaga silvatica]|uniref:DinB family protein n=1 Tax=Chitinophaga silvatica TaxID=2282649 RepID=A0A3E1Y6F2_9BACT|nr:DinB family protein [Chitinophaga silvatica]RFS20497.1 DinB family protein [Chitinophaga silvatica]